MFSRTWPEDVRFFCCSSLCSSKGFQEKPKNNSELGCHIFSSEEESGLSFISMYILCIHTHILMFIFERETEHEWGRAEREREGDTESEASSRLSAQSPTQGLNPGTVRS